MKTILVSLAHIGRVEDVIKTAAIIARHHDSHVIGFYPIPGPSIYAIAYPGAFLPVDDRVKKAYEKEEAVVRAKFEDQMKRDGLNYEWRHLKLATTNITKAVVEHGREADLIVLSQNEPNASGLDIDINLAAEVVLDAGRPVLVVPPLNGRTPSIKKAVIGWNASREACRAAFDAIPLAQMAAEVHLTWVNPEKTLGQGGKLPGAELGAALARHDIQITTKGLSNRSKPGAALLNYVRDENADLLIMGAYGRSRLSERILGGATETVLKNAKIPVLMSN
jgi:nucleotide-binding universal stress UspA family protein